MKGDLLVSLDAPSTAPPPDFRCPKGHAVGAHRNGGGAPWTPLACVDCLKATRARDARARRKLGPVVAGVDLAKAFAIYRRSLAFVGRLPRHVRLTVSHSETGGCGGFADVRRRELRIHAGPDATPAAALEVLVHEMCHFAVPPREGHGERFRLTLRNAAWQLWQIPVALRPPLEQGDRVVAYVMDRLIEAHLDRQIAAGAVDLSVFAPEPPRRPAHAPKAPLIERRAAIARRLLARAERDERAAARRVAKWARKVRYYDKALAKRGPQ